MSVANPEAYIIRQALTGAKEIIEWEIASLISGYSHVETAPREGSIESDTKGYWHNEDTIDEADAIEELVDLRCRLAKVDLALKIVAR